MHWDGLKKKRRHVERNKNRNCIGLNFGETHTKLLELQTSGCKQAATPSVLNNGYR